MNEQLQEILRDWAGRVIESVIFFGIREYPKTTIVDFAIDGSFFSCQTKSAGALAADLRELSKETRAGKLFRSWSAREKWWERHWAPYH